MKKFLLLLLGILLLPVLLFVLLGVALYVPAIQQWAVDTAACVASEQTGWQVRVGEVRLRFPLNLSLQGVVAVAPGHYAETSYTDSIGREYGATAPDTVVQAERLVVNVALPPLFDSRVELRTLSLEGSRVNTLDLLSNIHIEGSVGRLRLASRGVEWLKEAAELNGAVVEDAHLLVLMADTAAEDTAKSEVAWRVMADEVTLRRSRVELHLPGDSVRMAVAVNALSVAGVDIDLGQSDYRIEKAELSDGNVVAQVAGLPVMSIDSVSTRLRRLHLTDSHVALAEGLLSIGNSRVELEAETDMNIADSLNPGRLQANGRVLLSRGDVLRYTEMLTQPAWYPSETGKRLMDPSLLLDVRRYLESDVDVTLTAEGNMKQMDGELNVALRSMATDLKLNAILNDRHLEAVAEAHQPAGGTARLTAKTTLQENYMSGDIDVEQLAYEARIAINRLNLRPLVPGAGLGRLTASASLKGRGVDPQRRTTRIEGEAQVAGLDYDTLHVSDMDMRVRLKGGQVQGTIDSRWPKAMGCIDINGIMGRNLLQATIAADLKHADLYGMGLTEAPMQVGVCMHVDVESDLKRQHSLTVQAGDIILRDSAQTYRPDDLWLDALTSPDTTWVTAHSGDLQLELNGSGDYALLLDKTMKVADLMKKQYDERLIDQETLRREMPTMNLYLKSGSDNTVAGLLASQGISMKRFYLNAYASPTTGLNGNLQLHGLNAMGTQIDTIHLSMRHRMSRLVYGGRVVNSKKNPQITFAARFGGHLLDRGGDLTLRLFDAQGKEGLYLGANALMEENGLRLELKPQQPLIAYKKFDLNNDNYILLDGRNRVRAHVRLVAEDGTGIMLNSVEQDSTALQDLTLSLTRVNLKELTDIIPYAPHISGLMEGDYHIVMNQEGQISVASEMGVRQMAYEGSNIGNLGTSFVYMQREDSSHVVQGALTLEGEEFGLLDGSYKDDEIDASLTLTRLPLSLANGFVPDQMVGLAGYGEGTLKVAGPTDRLRFNGLLMLDSAFLVSQPYGISMRFDDAPVQIANSRLVMNNFGLYANGVTKNKHGQGDVGDPIRINGYVDFLDTDNMYMRLNLTAHNFQLINAKENPKSVAYGKCFVNMMAMLQGPMNNLDMRGKLDVLGKTDLSYVLRDSPLTTDTQLSELVKFVDFSDTTKTITVERPAVEGLNMAMQVDISQGAHVMAYLNQDHSNYVDLTGGGSLTMNYSLADALQLTGRYTLRGGEMKYSLPVIPLKTFSIQDGSYIEFTGNPMNPTLNIIATERMKANVTSGNGVGRSVDFDCGVEITKTLSDMGLAFTLDAPEDMSLSQELQSMSQEQRGKLAVSLLTTGMYLAEGQGSTEDFTMNSALTSFLNSEINQIAGSALRTLDVQLGVDNTTDASGEIHTDYSFKFAKRFWNNRVKVQVGGLYSTGNEAQSFAQSASSFFDNVSIEYRLDDTANKYVTLFYENNSYDWLEGYTQLYGGGFIWRRTLSRLRDIFRFSDKSETMPSSPMMRPASAPAAPTDSVKAAPVAAAPAN